MKKTALIALLTCAAFAVPTLAYAEDPAPAAAEEAPAPAAEPTSAAKVEPLSPDMAKKAEHHKEASAKAAAAVSEIGKGLEGDNARHFFTIYNNYNLIETVKMVQTDVGNAVKSCGEKNPGLSEKMNTRFDTWNKAVGDIISEAQANMDNMIVAQDYTPADKIRSSFKLLDEARDASNAYIDKQPVTTEDACNHLLNKMDDTQENLTTLLRRTLMSHATQSDSGKVAPTEPAKAE